MSDTKAAGGRRNPDKLKRSQSGCPSASQDFRFPDSPAPRSVSRWLSECPANWSVSKRRSASRFTIELHVGFPPVIDQQSPGGLQGNMSCTDLLVQVVFQCVLQGGVPGGGAIRLRPKVLRVIGAPQVTTYQMVNFAPPPVTVGHTARIIVARVTVRCENLLLHRLRDMPFVLAPLDRANLRFRQPRSA